jgi:hypothetical protein
LVLVRAFFVFKGEGKMKNIKHNVLSIVFYSVIIVLALILPDMTFATPVPDTGQTKCYNDTGEIPCPQQGEHFYGQDAEYGLNLHSYTDLGNGVVQDNVTALEWQQATAPGPYTWQQAIDYCNNLSLSGKDDWRLPTIKELSTLVDSSIPYSGPTINVSYFPDTVSSYYWSSTTGSEGADYAWFVGFHSGFVSTWDKSLGIYVRAVRGGQTSNHFVDNSDGTITDTNSGLMWQQATAPGTYTWEQALTYCENLTLPAGGYSDWRLPNRNELQSIVDYSRYNPAIDTTYFPDTVSSYYWSSTTGAVYSPTAWLVRFYDSYIDYYYGNKSLYYYVRTVRGPVDSDGDGIDISIDNCPNVYNPGQADSDGDGLGDVCDNCPYDSQNDVDGDGVCGDNDNCPNNPNGPNLGTCSSTSDKAGVTCQSDADCVIGCSTNGQCSKNQEDTDLDGIGDVCDNCANDPQNDIDGDGICGDVDNCPNEANADQADDNGDNIGNACDYKYWKTRFIECQNLLTTTTTSVPPDTDADGYPDDVDNCPTNCNMQQLDADGDGIGDVCDPQPGCGGDGQPQCEQECYKYTI